MEAKVVARGPTHPFDDTLTYFAAIRPDNAERSITLTIPVRFAADYINLSANSNITKSHTRLVEIKTVDTKKDRLNALFRAQTQLDQEMHGLASHERIILRNRTTRVCNCVITRTVRGEWLGGHTCRCDEERGHLLASAETHFMTRLSIILSSAIISGPPSFSTPAGSIAAEAAEKAPVSPVGPVSLAPPGAPAEPSAEAKQSKAQEIKAIKERKEFLLMLMAESLHHPAASSKGDQRILESLKFLMRRIASGPIEHTRERDLLTWFLRNDLHRPNTNMIFFRNFLQQAYQTSTIPSDCTLPLKTALSVAMSIKSTSASILNAIDDPAENEPYFKTFMELRRLDAAKNRKRDRPANTRSIVQLKIPILTFCTIAFGTLPMQPIPCTFLTIVTTSAADSEEVRTKAIAHATFEATKKAQLALEMAARLANPPFQTYEIRSGTPECILRQLTNGESTDGMTCSVCDHCAQALGTAHTFRFMLKLRYAQGQQQQQQQEQQQRATTLGGSALRRHIRRANRPPHADENKSVPLPHGPAIASATPSSMISASMAPALAISSSATSATATDQLARLKDGSRPDKSDTIAIPTEQKQQNHKERRRARRMLEKQTAARPRSASTAQQPPPPPSALPSFGAPTTGPTAGSTATASALAGLAQISPLGVIQNRPPAAETWWRCANCRAKVSPLLKACALCKMAATASAAAAAAGAAAPAEAAGVSAEGAPTSDSKYGGPTSASPVEAVLDCVACRSNQKCILLMPCRHLCLCLDCFEKIKSSKPECPLCRARFVAQKCVSVFI